MPASGGAPARRLLPLAAAAPARPLGLNVPLWALVSLFAAFSLLWNATAVPRLTGVSPGRAPAIPLVAAEQGAEALAQAIRHTAAVFPAARSVVLARIRPGTPDDWLLVEVDGKALRAPAAGADIQAALSASGVQLDEGDRVLVLPNEGAPVSAGPFSRFRAPIPAQRVVVQRALPFSVLDGGVPSAGRAAASTVGEALRAVGIDVNAADVVQPPTESRLTPGLRIAILRAQPVTVTGPDVQVEGRTRAQTVAELLGQWGVTLGPIDRTEPPLDAPVPVNGTVRVVRVREEDRTEVQPLPYRTQATYDARLLPGTRLRVRTGLPGLVQRLLRVVTEDESETARQVLSEEILRWPVDEVVASGPAVVPALSLPGVAAPQAPGIPEGVSARRVLSMVATAYDAGPVSTGKRPGDPGYGVTATGMRATYGVVAVDPRVIPLYSRLYIPGYGFAVAADTGAAIVGNRVDLFFPSYSDALHFGRRTVTVYVLE